MAVINHKGKFYNVPEGVSEQDFRRRIDEGLLDSSKKEELVARDRIVDPATESEGAFQEVAEGIGSGLTKGIQGVAELGGIAIDSVFDTNTLGAIEQTGENVRDYLGLDPVGFGGKAADIVTQFVIPGLGAAGAVSKISKLGKLEKAIRQQGRGLSKIPEVGPPLPARLTGGQQARLRGQQAGAAFLVDAAVAEDGMTTIGDFVEGGPTLTEKDIGLSGRAEAGRRFRNKVRVGGEAGALAMAFPYLLSTTAVAFKPALYLTGELIAPVASGTKQTLQKISEAVGDTETAKAIGNITVPRKITRLAGTDPDSTIGDVYEGVKAKLRFRGNLSTEAAERRGAVQGFIDRQANNAAYVIRDFERDMKKIFKGAEEVELEGFGRLSRTEVMNSIYGFLTKDPSFVEGATTRRAAIRFAARNGRTLDPNSPEDLVQALPDFAQKTALKMRNQIDDLSARVLNSDYGTQNVSDQVRNEITENLGKYIRRKYRVFDDPDAYFASQEYRQNREQVAQFLQQNPNTTRNLFNKIVSEADLGNQLDADAAITPTIINDVIDTFVNRYRSKTGFLQESEKLSRTAKQRMSREMFQSRRLDEDVLKKLLGEIKSPEEAYVRTVGDLAETIALDDFYGFMRQGRGRIEFDPATGANVRVGGTDIIDGDVYNNLSLANKSKYIELTDTGFGSLSSTGDGTMPATRTFARRPVYNDLTRNTRQMNPVFNMAFSSFMLGKGFSQKVKTVYSPITQLRNVTSAAMFAAAQGNVGRGANVFESVNLVLENIKKTSPEERAAFFQELQELGVVGTQAQLRELERVIEDGLSRTSADEVDAFGVHLGQKKSRSRGGQFLGSLDKLARDLYQGGDDIWKIYNFDFERSKILNAFAGDMNAAEAYVKSITNSSGESVYKNLNEYAADIVKNTVPNYERVPEFVQDLRKLPLGNFIAFPAEIVRTSVNTLGRAIDEVQRGARMRNQGRETGNQALIDQGERIRDIGKRRLNGFAGTVLVAGPAVQETALIANDLSRDTIDALREIAPPWSKNSTLIPTSVDKNGNVVGYVDFSFTNPYDYLRRPVRAVMNAVNDGRELDLDAEDVMLQAGAGVLSELMGPFAEESIITERLLDVTARGGETRTGARVWRSEDSAGEKIKKGIYHAAEAFEPTILSETIGIVPDVRPTGDIDYFPPGRLVTSFLKEEGLDSRGNVRLVGEEILRQLTGIGEIKVSPKTSFLYRTYEHNEGTRQAQSNFNRQLRAFGRTIEDPSLVFENYRRENERKLKAFNKGYRLIENMKALGMDDREIRSSAKELGFSGYKKILQGRFEPINIDTDIVNEIAKFYKSMGRSFDRRGLLSELNKIKREYATKPLTAEGAQERAKRPVFSIEGKRVQPNQTSAVEEVPPATVDQGAAPVSLPNAAPVQTSQAPGAGATISDPRTRELFERLRGIV